MRDYFVTLHKFVQSNTPCATGLVIAGIEGICPPGTRLIFSQGLQVFGQVAEEVRPRLAGLLAEVLAARDPRVVTAEWQGRPIRLFVEPIYPPARLIILGGGHIAVPLASMGKTLGFQVSVVDDRPTFANQTRFPEADQVLCQDFRAAIVSLGIDLNSYVIIVTRGHQHDRTCLEEVLRQQPAAYVGMIGSRRKCAAVLNDLRETGADPMRLAAVYAPIGLDIGAQTPEEIAVSIIAEIIMVRHKGYSNGLKNRLGGRTGGQPGT